MGLASKTLKTVAAGQTDSLLGTIDQAGAKLKHLIVVVATAATSAVSIKDGSGSAISVVPANTPVGVYPLELDAISEDGGWKITTAAGVSVVAVGHFP